MPATLPPKFFATYRSWQWIKHQILSDYLTVWARKVGSFAPSIHIIDAFAGAGHYDGGSGNKVEGSPLIEARAAKIYQLQYPNRTIDVFCIERDPHNYKRLEESVAPFRDLVQVRQGDFFKYIPEILNVIKSDPALILFDPIGLKPITADRCRPLLARSGATDIFVVVDFQIVHRSAGQLMPDGQPSPAYVTAPALIANIDGFFSTSEWRAVSVNPVLTVAEREEAYLELYFRKVLESRYKFRCAYPVRARHDGPPEYWIVNASNHERAFWLMNDCLAAVDSKLMRKTLAADDQLPGFLDETVAAYVKDTESALGNAVVAALRGPSGAIPFAKLRSALVPTFFGRVTEATYPRVVKSLVKAGRVCRQKNLTATLVAQELVSVPPS